MAANYVLLASQTVGAAGASSVTFSNIPQTGYTDLLIKISARDGDTSGALTALSFNGLTSNLSSKRLRGNGTAASSATLASNIYIASEPGAYTASVFSSSDTYIPNYASANFKSVSDDSTGENNATASEMQLAAGLWSATAAITSVTLTPAVSPYAQYSTFYLYGIAASGVTPVIAPFATGGNVTNDGTYWIHTFLASGTFTPLKTLSCDYLVVAGGGATPSASNSGGGGAGAGGLRSTVTATGGGGSLETALSLTAANYTVTVGAGGAINSNGSNSVFSTITSTGGGKGSAGATAAATGGSGGGGSDTTQTQGSGTANQGYAGGIGNGNGGGGGGGAGAVGTVIATDNAGAGIQVAITGSSLWYAAGGQGGGNNAAAAKNGIGGIAEYPLNSGTNTAGTANTGSGAGGAWNSGSYTGKTGGSGIVIVRYAMV